MVFAGMFVVPVWPFGTYTAASATEEAGTLRNTGVVAAVPPVRTGVPVVGTVIRSNRGLPEEFAAIATVAAEVLNKASLYRIWPAATDTEPFAAPVVVTAQPDTTPLFRDPATTISRSTLSTCDC